MTQKANLFNAYGHKDRKSYLKTVKYSVSITDDEIKDLSSVLSENGDGSVILIDRIKNLISHKLNRLILEK